MPQRLKLQKHIIGMLLYYHAYQSHSLRCNYNAANERQCDSGNESSAGKSVDFMVSGQYYHKILFTKIIFQKSENVIGWSDK